MARYDNSRVLRSYELLENIMLHSTSVDLSNMTKVCRFWRDLAGTSKALRCSLVCSRVFGTYEIFENILLHCTSFDICNATKVCCFWVHVIETSKLLRKSLYRQDWIHFTPFNIEEAVEPLDINTRPLNSSLKSSWHFSADAAADGVIFGHRLHDQKHSEVWLLVPASPEARIIALDSHRHKREAKINRSGLPDFIWTYDSRERNGNVESAVITRTYNSGYGSSAMRYLKLFHEKEFDEVWNRRKEEDEAMHIDEMVNGDRGD